jgi:ribosome-binding factor A
MPERRGASHHRGRVAEALREEIVAILEGELGDPRIGLCTVTEVVLAPDGRSARIFVQVEGDLEEGERTLEGLEAAKTYIRHEVRDRLGVRQSPELHFVLDRSNQAGGRIDELLQRVQKRTGKKPEKE